MGELRISRFYADHMVLQQEKPILVRGWDKTGRKVTVTLYGESTGTGISRSGTWTTDGEGRWKVALPAMKACGPLRMKVEDDAGEELNFEDVWIGEVWFCTGQSNMDICMDRVADHYPEEVGAETFPNIRTFRIQEHAEYAAPLEDPLTGTWVPASKETILQIGATAYFFGKNLQSLTDPDLAVGLIHASLGGSRIQGWMSRKMLEGYDYMLAEAARYAAPGYMEKQNTYNEEKTMKWYREVDQADAGLTGHWEKEEDWSRDAEMEVPCMFRELPDLTDFCGSIWLHRSFDMPEDVAEDDLKKDMKLWLGTLVDTDETYVNGVFAGSTPYQYPPRKYKVPGGTLRKKDNHLVIRLRVETGLGRVTPGKELKLFTDDMCLDLSGTWQYRIGMRQTYPMPPTDFVNWHPTGLYNGMTYPSHQMAIRGIIWYQGESNTWLPEDYYDLTKRQVQGYREAWQEKDLPYLFVQLPNFEMDQTPTDKWYEFRERQRKCLEIPHTGMAVAIDLGEDNDLHPMEKREVGRRLALQAAHMVYGKTFEEGDYTGPVPDSAKWTGEGEILLQLEHFKGLKAFSKDKGEIITDFTVEDGLNNVYPAKAEKVDGEKGEVLLSFEKRVTPLFLRYCYSNTNRGALLYNGADLPMTPFRMLVEDGR